MNLPKAAKAAKFERGVPFATLKVHTQRAPPPLAGIGKHSFRLTGTARRTVWADHMRARVFSFACGTAKTGAYERAYSHAGCSGRERYALNGFGTPVGTAGDERDRLHICRRRLGAPEGRFVLAVHARPSCWVAGAGGVRSGCEREAGGW